MDVEYLIEGERAALGPLRRDLAETYARWVNRIEVRQGLSNLGIYDRQAEEAWLEETARNNGQVQPSEAHFTIYDRRDGEPVGTCALMDSATATHGRSSGSCSASAAARASGPRRRG